MVNHKANKAKGKITIKPHTNLCNKEIKEKEQSGHHQGEKSSKKKKKVKTIPSIDLVMISVKTT